MKEKITAAFCKSGDIYTAEVCRRQAITGFEVLPDEGILCSLVGSWQQMVMTKDVRFDDV